MHLAMVDLKDQDVRALTQIIAYICFSEEFKTLKQELEYLYSAAGIDNPAFTAFQDTLYALLCQQEEDYNHVKSCAH
jgi:hypothetical protein